MSEVANTLRQELAFVEANVVKLESEAMAVQTRLRLALDKADKLKAVLALYTNEEVEPAQPRLFAPPSIQPSDQRIAANPAKGASASKSARIKAEVVGLLSARGTEHRQKILDHLIAKGVMGQEKTPMANLAAYLSMNKNLFVADGRGNFSLRRDGHQEPPPELHNGSGSAEVLATAPSASDVLAVKGTLS